MDKVMRTIMSVLGVICLFSIAHVLAGSKLLSPPQHYMSVQKEFVITLQAPVLVSGEEARVIWDHATNSKIDAIASSSLNPRLYPATNLFDFNFRSCWAIDGRIKSPAWILFHTVATSLIYNGLWASKTLFYANNRVKTARIIFYEIYSRKICDDDVNTPKSKRWSEDFLYGPYLIGAQTVVFPDHMRPISITIPYCPIPYDISYENDKLPEKKQANSGRLLCKLEIIDTYPGHTYNDTCITEIVGFRINPTMNTYRFGE